MNYKIFTEIETPTLILDIDKLQANIDRVQNIATKHHLQLRPHIKTHKCLEIAQMQISSGAKGITAAKVDEAIKFIEKGIQSVTVAYPLISSTKIKHLVQIGQKYSTDLNFVVDSPVGLNEMIKVSEDLNANLNIFIKIDVGLHRCGVKEDSEEVISLAQTITINPRLHLIGILSHAGQAYGATGIDEVREIANKEQQIMTRVMKKLQRENIEIEEISVGSTPTILGGDYFNNITEIRPGNYVFLDRTGLRLGICKPEEIALSVLAKVVSINDQYYIIDAGSKVFSSDISAHGSGGLQGYGSAYPVDEYLNPNKEMIISKLSEEHGFVNRNGVELSIGSQVRVLPNHSCPVANLANEYLVLKGDNIYAKWSVMARGCVQ